MAITFRGGVVSPIIFGNNDTTQTLFSLENGVESRVNVLVRDLNFTIDSLVALTAVKPLVKTCRAITISGGITVPKGKFDTALTSDAAVVARTAFLEGAPITATATDIVFQRFGNRVHTAVEQSSAYEGEGDNRNGLLPPVLLDKDFVLAPGESLIVQVIAAATTSNAALTNNATVTCVWEEDAIATFAISGTVTLSAAPVAGAIVTVVEADDTDMTNAHVREVITTPGGGTWASTIRTGKVGAAFVQYESGGTKYTAPGSPYLE